MSNGIDFQIFTLPNHGIVLAELKDKDMEYLWNAIEEGKKDNINTNKTLAGNISTSLAIKDKDNKILSYICSLNLLSRELPIILFLS